MYFIYLNYFNNNDVLFKFLEIFFFYHLLLNLNNKEIPHIRVKKSLLKKVTNLFLLDFIILVFFIYCGCVLWFYIYKIKNKFRFYELQISTLRHNP